MKNKETIEITWYDPTEVPVMLTEVSGRSVDVMMQYSSDHDDYPFSEFITVMYYDKRNKQWYSAINDEPLKPQLHYELTLNKWCYIPVSFGGHLLLTTLIEQVQTRCYDNFKRLESIR